MYPIPFGGLKFNKITVKGKYLCATVWQEQSIEHNNRWVLTVIVLELK